ncbi:hypothetical protein F4778DRAFT_639186 [Xylariomycetidae sp. FL2044]|nr:hypothetical protein F4778DRAFT_639186 [Xylariomycetidae sp. FL2044]
MRRVYMMPLRETAAATLSRLSILRTNSRRCTYVGLKGAILMYVPNASVNYYHTDTYVCILSHRLLVLDEQNIIWHSIHFILLNMLYSDVLTLLLLPGVGAATAQPPTCYLPNRSIDTKSLPCNVTATQNGGASACCLPNDICFDSGACFQDWSGITYRQGCTDPSFQSAECPKFCLDEGMLSDGIWIQSCDMKTKKACCYTGDSSCCNDTESLFTYKPGYTREIMNENGTNRLSALVDDVDLLSETPTTSSAGASIHSGPASATDGLSNGSASAAPAASSTSSFPPAAAALVAIFGTLTALSMVTLGVLWVKQNNTRKKLGSVAELHASEVDDGKASSSPDIAQAPTLPEFSSRYVAASMQNQYTGYVGPTELPDVAHAAAELDSPEGTMGSSYSWRDESVKYVVNR